jgi:hypothetical protein
VNDHPVIARQRPHHLAAGRINSIVLITRVPELATAGNGPFIASFFSRGLNRLRKSEQHDSQQKDQRQSHRVSACILNVGHFYRLLKM